MCAIVKNDGDFFSQAQPQGVPTKLYKFRGLDYKYLNDILINRRLFLNTPNQFNDPFDCNPFMLSYNQIDSNSQVKAKSILDNLLKRNDNLTAKTIYYNLSWLKDGKNPILSEAIYENLIYEFVKYIRILCLFTSVDNTLQWSHYADYHKGIALEFEYDKINLTGYSTLSLDKVEYIKEYETINLNDFDNWSKVLTLRKGKFWEYEWEYRLVLKLLTKDDENNYTFNESNNEFIDKEEAKNIGETDKYYFKFNDNLTGIYFGVRCPLKNVIEIMEFAQRILKKSSIIFYQCYISNSNQAGVDKGYSFKNTDFNIKHFEIKANMDLKAERIIYGID